MAAPFSTWNVREHGELTQLEENLWHVDAAIPGVPHLRRRMIVVRLASGALALHSVIALDDRAMAALEALGTPEIFIVPNRYHRLDIGAYKARYPRAKIYCPRAAMGQVAKLAPPDGDYDAAELGPGASLSHLEGCAGREGVMEIDSNGKVTLVFNDVVFNQPHLPGGFGLVYRLIGSSGGPRVTRLAKTALIKDRKATALHLLRLAETPRLARVVPGHGDLIESLAPEVLRQIAATA